MTITPVIFYFIFIFVFIVNDRTNMKVLYWFVFQLILILSLGAWQVYYVTRFFEVKRVV